MQSIVRAVITASSTNNQLHCLYLYYMYSRASCWNYLYLVTYTHRDMGGNSRVFLLFQIFFVDIVVL